MNKEMYLRVLQQKGNIILLALNIYMALLLTQIYFDINSTKEVISRNNEEVNLTADPTQPILTMVGNTYYSCYELSEFDPKTYNELTAK